MQAVTVPQIHTQTTFDLSSLLQQKKNTQADAPRVLYQCADCEVLFDALSLWQQHRKMGCCLETGSAEEQTGETYEIVDQQQSSQTENDIAEQAQNMPEQTQVKEVAEILFESTSQGSVEVAGKVAAPAISEQEESSNRVPKETSATQEAPSVETSAEATSPVTRRRGQKKAKPPSSLLCVECGQSFSLVPELVTHRRTQHGLKDAIHRCAVCGEGFLNTTLYLYHRRQHRSEVEEEPKQAPPGIPQISTAMLEAPGEGLLLLATAGEGQSLMEVTTLEQTITETPAAQVEVELDSNEIRGAEQVPVVEGAEILVEKTVEMLEELETTNQEEKMEVVIVKVEGHVEMEKSGAEEEIQEAVESNASEEPSTAFLCHQCGSVFNNDQELAKHRSAEHGLEAALHTCADCGAEFMSTTQFLYHRREHKNTTAGHPATAEVKSRLYTAAASGIVKHESQTTRSDSTESIKAVPKRPS